MTYLELLDKANEAKTTEERVTYLNQLQGYLLCLKEEKLPFSGLACDLHTFEKFGKRPMCCGTLLDWKPSEPA